MSNNLPCVAKLHFALSFSMYNAVKKKNKPPRTKTPVGIYKAYCKLKNLSTLFEFAKNMASDT